MMDFIIQLPPTKKGYDAIFIVVDKLSKTIKAILTKITIIALEVANLFFLYIFHHFSLPSTIILNHNSHFIGKFW